jgi:phosphohistidine swiveling domain-containing protein
MIGKVDVPYGVWTLDQHELKRFKWWMTYDPIHKPEPMTPLAGCILAFLEQHGFCYGADKVSMPVSKGMCCRLSPEGYEAISEAMSTTEEETKKRSPTFRNFVESFLSNFEQIWGDFRHKGKVGSYLLEIQRNYARIGTFDLESWLFDLEKFQLQLEKLSDGDILDKFFEVLDVNRRTWEIHFEIMYTAFSVYMDFEALTKELFGFGDEFQDFKKLMQGFDNKIYDCDLELWRILNLLVEYSLTEIFAQHPLETILSELAKRELGKKWLKEFKNFLAVYGRRSAVPHDIFKSTWLEDPTLVLRIIKDRLSEAPLDYEAERKRITKEREETVTKLMGKIPSERKEGFKRLLKGAQIAYCWNEDHNYWIEQMWSSSTRYVVLEMGRRLANGGAISEPDDVFFINPEEIRATFLAAIEGRYDFRELVAERKTKWKSAFKKIPQRITGEWDRSKVRDPVMIKVFGLGPLGQPSEKVDVFGYPGSAGICEGTASVVVNVDELHRVETGNILVTGATNPAWTPIFSKIKGVVTDHGGTLSHAAIVAREYGIPAIVGTKDATQKIKDGQKIRIDGNRGYVWIIS